MMEKGTVKAIIAKTTDTGKTYWKVTMSDGKEYSCWDARIAAMEGKEIDFNGVQKGKYLNLYLPDAPGQQGGGNVERRGGGGGHGKYQADDPMRNASMFYSYSKDLVCKCIETGFLDFKTQEHRVRAICDAVHYVAKDLYGGAQKMAESMGEKKS